MSPEVIDSYDRVKIMHSEGSPFPLYIVLQPEFSPEEEKIAKNPTSVIGNYEQAMDEIEKLQSSKEKEEYLKKFLREKLEGKGINSEHMDDLILHIMDHLFMGYGRLGILMRDERLEEVMINSSRDPVFVFHRRHGMCMSNIEYDSDEELENLVLWLSKYVGREINEDHPLLDAHMPDGSRANVAIPPASPYGPTITIRKFKKTPFNVINLIEAGTLSTDLAAFLWLGIEGMGLSPSDMIISGGAGSGKTTLLNALAMFIPQTERVITVEDTLELNFEFLENWVPLEAKPSVMEDSSLTMHALLQNSLRMRPDRVIVGEVRGHEAETLLIAMDIGLHGSMGTIHANNPRETTIRLLDDPMNVPIRMIPLIDLVVVMGRIYDRKRGMIRRCINVSEISGIEGEVVQMGDIYYWDVNTDKIVKTEYPILLKEKIAKNCGITKRRLNAELFIREKVLQYMIDNKIKSTPDVINLIQRYHMNPKDVIREIKGQMVDESQFGDK
ncbi:MAG: ATPase, T2SS/T4P/T4SS family [Candidatus Altiarchaeota archaeon]